MFCFKCGNDMGTIEFPHTCSCGQFHYRNPIPVAVGIVPCRPQDRGSHRASG